MLLNIRLHLIPTTLILLIATTPNPSWTLYSHHGQELIRRQPNGAGSVEENAQGFPNQVPVRVRKMSDDEGEMFFNDYWGFEDLSARDLVPPSSRRISSPSMPDSVVKDESTQLRSNASIALRLQAPFALHTDDLLARPLVARLLRAPNELFSLEKREFQCPGGTNVCTSINRPNSCCYSGSTCELVPVTGLGDVGCCGSGQSCGAQVASCTDGNTACPGADGGGCCLPGYSCSGVGCQYFRSD